MFRTTNQLVSFHPISVWSCPTFSYLAPTMTTPSSGPVISLGMVHESLRMVLWWFTCWNPHSNSTFKKKRTKPSDVRNKVHLQASRVCFTWIHIFSNIEVSLPKKHPKPPRNPPTPALRYAATLGPLGSRAQRNGKDPSSPGKPPGRLALGRFKWLGSIHLTVIHHGIIMGIWLGWYRANPNYQIYIYT